jgi:hypothetical protein
MANGLGGLLTTEVVTSDLGTYGGRHLRARVQRRALRLALGSRLRGSVVRLRPLAVEWFEVDGQRDLRVVPIEAPPDPLVQAVQRVLMLWVVSMVLRRVATSLRRDARSRQAMRRDAGKAA